MHNRKRRPKGEPVPEAETQKKMTKLRLYQKLSHAVIALRAATAKPVAVESKEDEGKAQLMVMNALKATAKMATVNPDFYSLWNLRRDLLTTKIEALRGSMQSSNDVCAEESSKSAEDELRAISQTEMDLTQAALTKRNPKCYYAWHHRKWVVSLGYVDLKRELRLCEEFLEKDERNFHCWTYRRCVLASIKSPPSEELLFTDTLIARNFSNGSAWHQRTRVILDGVPAADVMGILTDELEKIREAIFTEPDDQSAWMYQRWVLAQIMSQVAGDSGHETSGESSKFYGKFMQRLSNNWRSTDGPSKVITGPPPSGSPGQTPSGTTKATDGQNLKEIFDVEMRTCRELIDVEPSCRWPRLQLLYMIRNLQQMSTNLCDREAMNSERTHLLAELLELDPTHAGYYRDCLRKLST